MTVLIIAFWILVPMGLFLFLTRKYVNPYKLIYIFGKKGSGKSTLLQKLTYRYLRKGWTVYSTEVQKSYRSDNGREEETRLLEENSPLKEAISKRKKKNRKLGNSGLSEQVNFLDPPKIFDYHFPEKTCILIDEVSLIWDNRDFKKMDKRVVEWFRYQRHHKCRVYMFSQNFDCDAKLRQLADDMYLVEKYFRVFVVAKHIVRKPVVVHPGPESPARIDDDMIVDGPLLAPFGGRLFAFIPYWARKFDSYTTDYKKKGGSDDTQD